VSRDRFTATLLPDGRVLITGGLNGTTYLASAEVYDPGTGLFNPTGALAAARGDHCATLLPNGTVLITGGTTGSGALATAEVYDPATGKFSPAGALLAARKGHTALLLPSGKVLVAGGVNGTSYLTTAELYDPATGLATATGSLVAARSDHKGVVLPNGTVLIMGGETGSAYLATAELYDPGTGKWSTVAGVLSAGRTRHAVTILANGAVLVSGGFNGVALVGADLYDPAVPNFTATGASPLVSTYPKSVLLPSGKVLIAGGSSLIVDAPITEAALYDPPTKSFATTSPKAIPRVHHTINLLPNGKVLVTGGRVIVEGLDRDFTRLTELYDPATETWSATSPMFDERAAAGSALLPNGKVLVVGGIYAGRSYHSTAELYDPETKTWTRTGSMSVGRFRPTVTLLPNGKVLITGGRGGNDGISAPYLASAEIYDPETGKFTLTGSMTVARGYHTATLLPNGKVLVVGGSTGSEEFLTFLTSTELYDPATGQFTATGSMSQGRIYHKATLLPDGKVLVVGGGYWDVIAIAELYDPATRTWSSAGNLLYPRASCTAQLLPDGNVLVFGSIVEAHNEVYEPGLGFAESRRPVVASSTLGNFLQFSGNNLRGGTEGSGSFPLLTLFRLDNEQIFHGVVDPVFSWSATGFTSTLPPALPYGSYLLTATANGIPSVSQVLTQRRPLDLSPASIDFGTVYYDGTPNTATTTVTLTNPGRTSITVTSTAVTGAGFTLHSGTCGSPPFTLAANGGACDMAVMFAPVSTQGYGGSMVVTVQSGHTITGALSGRGDTLTSSLLMQLEGPGVALGAITGTVTGVGAPISINITKTTDLTVPTGSTATLTANTTYATWSGCDYVIRGVCTVAIPIDRTVTVTFPTLAQHAVSFYSNGGSAVAGQIVVTGGTATRPPDPTSPGASFVGWYLDAGLTALYAFSSPITANTVLYAKWRHYTFYPTGAMITARYDHTVTLLTDGTVLVAGGAGGNSTAERYDPATGKFSATGAMQAGHEGHTATLLTTGEVLIAGGATTLAERYHPTTGQFSVTGAMNMSRSQSTATLLPDGRVLITGGHNGTTYLATAEVYDPATGKFSATGNLAVPRGEHCATLLPNGTVLITGGTTGSGALAAAEVYDPVTGQFSSAAPLLAARSGHTALLLPNGKVLVAGGYDGTTYLGTAELYDPATGLVTATGSLASVRGDHKGVVLPNGTVLVMGGFNGAAYLATGELYDPGAGKWSAATDIMSTGRTRHAVTILGNGRVLVVGGFNGAAVAGADLYDSSVGKFAVTGIMVNNRRRHSATLLPSGKVLITGGSVGTAVELYDPSSGTFTASSPTAVARFGHTTTLLTDGKVLVAGGEYNVSYAYTSAELYDPATGTWTNTGAMNDSRAHGSATLLPDGKVLVVGGFYTSWTYRASAELYDPATGTWSRTGSMAVGRFRPTVTLLPNGKVLIAGGRGGGTGGGAPYQASAEIYDPATGQFTPTGSMTTARGYHTASLLPNGKVLVSGGSTSPETYLTYLTTAELYDPATGTWTPTGSMAYGRLYHRQTLLPDGTVLVAGGGYNMTAGAELYDPARGIWTPTGSLAEAFGNVTGTLLPSGKVLIAGENTTGKAELYDPGLGFADSRRPVVASSALGSSLRISGAGFTGGTEGSGSFPLATLQRLDNEQIVHGIVDPASSWSATGLTSALPPGLPYGSYLLTATANGIPSVSQILTLPRPLDLSPSSLDFGTVYYNSMPNTATASVTLTNPRRSVVTVVSTAVSGAVFTLQGGTCGAPPFTLAANGGSCDLSITFAPTSTRNYGGSVVITDATGHTISGALSGQGDTHTSTLLMQIVGPGAALGAITGTMTGVGDPIKFKISTTTAQSAPTGSTAILTANTIYASWSGCDSTAGAVCTVAMTTGRTVIATFPPLTPYTVTFNSNGGSAVSSQSVVTGGTVARPPDPTKSHATFAGWYRDVGLANPFDFATPLTAATTLYAKWTIDTYTVSFDSTGGSPVSSQIVPYNSTATKPADPTRTVYPFLGWYTDSSLTTAFNFATPITGTITLHAKWARDNVALQTNGGSAAASSFLLTPTTSYAPAAVNNGDRTGMNPGNDGAWFDGTLSVWPDWVQVTFNGLKMIDEIDVFTVQDAYLAPVEPTEEMIFSKWGITAFEVQYWTGAAWQTVPGGSVTGNNLVWRKFTFSPLATDRIRVVVTGAVDTRSRISEIEVYGAASPFYTVTYNSNGGSAVSSQDVIPGGTATRQADPTFVGGAFAGWYSDAGLTNPFDFATPITADTTLYAKWTYYNFTVTFDSTGGSPVSSQTVLYNSTATKPADPVRTVYPFLGWYADNSFATPFSFATPITGNITLYAKWRDNVALQTNGGSAMASSFLSTTTTSYAPAAVINGDRKGVNSSQDGAWFDGTLGVWPDWVQVTFNGLKMIDEIDVFTVQDAFQAPVDPTAEMTFTKWGITAFEVQYWTGTVWQVVPGGSVTGNNLVWRKFTFPLVTTDRIRVTVTGAVDTRSRITEIEAYGMTSPTFTITFNSNGGSAVSSQTVAPAGVTTRPPDPTKTGDTFAGWYRDAGLTNSFDFATPITADMTLHAKWTRANYTVTFDSSGGSPVAGQIVPYNATATKPTDPARTVYLFLGWYADSSLTTPFNFATPIVGNITLHAKWALDNVALQANGGIATASSFQSTATASYAPSAVNNGDRTGMNPGQDGAWFDNTSGVWPDWVQVTFNGLKMIDEIDVFTVQDAYLAPVEPTAGMIFTKYGITVFEVQYWNGTAWQTVPGGSITGNNLIWRKFTFSPVTTDRIRVTVTGAVDTRTRITEIEAYGAASPSFMPVRIGSTYYPTLRAAYLAATDGSVIETQAISFAENLVLDRSAAITIKGGFNAGFTTQSSRSLVQGITIGSGKLIADRLGVK
jgi:uncharacterized repeat protein (TIGR02543 family)